MKIRTQDIAEGKGSEPEIKRGVATGRVVSTEDPEMRHGRKSSSTLFDGYKVHVAEELDTELITDVEVTPGNAAACNFLEGIPPTWLTSRPE